LWTSFGLLGISLVILGFWLQPMAIIPACLGVLLNILYEYAKAHGLLGNLVFGLMIMTCSLVGYLASGPLLPTFSFDFLAILLLVALLNGLMTFYTFFKDYLGDQAVGKRTLVVKYGLAKARLLALGGTFLPALGFWFCYLFGWLNFKMNTTFIFLAILTFLLQLWTGILYYKYPTGERTYYSLVVNFRACACGQATLISLFKPTLAWQLFLASYILIGFLFDLHVNSKA